MTRSAGADMLCCPLFGAHEVRHYEFKQSLNFFLCVNEQSDKVLTLQMLLARALSQNDTV